MCTKSRSHAEHCKYNADVGRAKKWEQRAVCLLGQLMASAKDGVAAAQLIMLMLGLGPFEQDEKEAVRYYELAAEHTTNSLLSWAC